MNPAPPTDALVVSPLDLFSVTLSWNSNDPGEGDYSTTVWARDTDDAIRAVAEEMADQRHDADSEDHRAYVQSLVLSASPYAAARVRDRVLTDLNSLLAGPPADDAPISGDTPSAAAIITRLELQLRNERERADFAWRTVTVTEKAYQAERSQSDRLRAELSAVQSLTQGACALADGAMRDQLHCHTLQFGDDPAMRQLTDDADRPIKTITDAEPAQYEAFRWLNQRNLCALIDHPDGLVVRLFDPTGGS